MKNLTKILYSFLLLTLFVACTEEDDSPFPADRKTADEEITVIEDKLMAPEYGWKTVLLSDLESVGGFNLTIKFNANGTCDMLSDFMESDETYASNAYNAEGIQSNISYDVQKATAFELSFETYCVLHELYDYGYISNYTYQFQSYDSDTLWLKNGEQAFCMVPASAEDWNMDAYNANEETFIEFYNYTILFCYLHQDDTPQIQIGLSMGSRSMDMYFFDADSNVVEVPNGFYYTQDGIGLKTPVEIEGYGTLEFITFGELEESSNSTLTLNVTLDNGDASQFYSNVTTMIPVDDGIEHFRSIEGVSLADGGSFWSSRPAFELGFRYPDTTTYFNLDTVASFSDFSIYLGYYNSVLDATYNMFSFVFGGGNSQVYYDVYFTYETAGTDQVYFSLDSEKGNGGYSKYINDAVRAMIEPMVNKMIQDEGFTMVSSSYVNPIDGSLILFVVDNKTEGFLYMRTGDLE